MRPGLAAFLHYTGYVVGEPAPLSGDAGPGQRAPDGEVLVSVGGGAVGQRLLEVALAGTADDQFCHNTGGDCWPV